MAMRAVGLLMVAMTSVEAWAPLAASRHPHAPVVHSRHSNVCSLRAVATKVKTGGNEDDEHFVEREWPEKNKRLKDYVSSVVLCSQILLHPRYI